MASPSLTDLRTSMKAQQTRIDNLIAQLTNDVDKASGALVTELLKKFYDKLDVEKTKTGNVILNNKQNQRLTAVIDEVFKKFNEKENIRIVSSILNGIAEINALNSEHFKQLYTKPIEPAKRNIEDIINQRFGINKDGTLKRDGYMMGLLDDKTVRNDIKQMAFKAITNSTGYNDFKSTLADYIQGNPDKAGIFARFYRNYAFDVYSQVDRINSFQYAERLQLNYAIYEGGIIETSRKFCRDRNGKVFSRAEIMKWTLTEAAPPDYDPITDLGGYGCRHYLNWITEELAFTLRPELRSMAA